MKKVFVVLGTARENSNTLKALREHLPYQDYGLTELHNLKLEPYTYDKNKPSDDFLSVVDRMMVADTIVFATPVYWYAMSGVMKIFFDRMTDLISTSKEKGRALKGKEVYLFSTGNDDVLPEGFEVPFRRTAEYFEMNYIGSKYVSFKD